MATDGMTPRKAGSVAALKVQSGRKFISGLARGIQLLEAFRPGDDSLSNADLSSRSGLPRPTISRLTHTLCELGYLEQTEDRRGFRLTPRMLTLSHPVLAKIRFRQVARPLMDEFAKRTQLSLALGVRDGHDMVFVERAKSNASSSITQDIGARIPIALSSMGRAYLAALHPSEREILLEQLARTLPSQRWQQIRANIERELARYAACGYCFSFGEWKAQAYGVSVPIVLHDGTLFAINCGGMGPLMKVAGFDEVGQRLKAIVTRMLASQGREVAA
jgi:DNA-binding IclR family transcriptional regulator